MSDDLPMRPIDADDIAGSNHGAALLLYDWYKNMTTLSLITLGGVLGIVQSGTSEVRPGVLGAIVTAIAIAGIIGFDGQHRIVQSVLSKKPRSRWLDFSRRLRWQAMAWASAHFFL